MEKFLHALARTIGLFALGVGARNLLDTYRNVKTSAQDTTLIICEIIFAVVSVAAVTSTIIRWRKEGTL